MFVVVVVVVFLQITTIKHHCKYRWQLLEPSRGSSVAIYRVFPYRFADFEPRRTRTEVGSLLLLPHILEMVPFNEEANETQ